MGELDTSAMHARAAVAPPHVAPPSARLPEPSPILGEPLPTGTHDEPVGPLRHRRRAAVWAAALAGVDVVTIGLTYLAIPDLNWKVLVTFQVLTVLLFANGGLYRARLYLSVLDDLPSIAGRAIVAGALATAIGVFDDQWVSRRILYFVAAVTVAVLITRGIAFAVARRARTTRRMRHRAVIMGGGEVGALLVRTLLDRPESGLDPIGFLDDDPLLALEAWPVPHLGGNDDLVDVVNRWGVDHIIVAFGSAREAAVIDILRACDRLACEILFVPRFYEVHATARDMEMVWGIPLVRMRRAPFRSVSWRLKRALDVAFSVGAMLFLAPVLAVCALAVRLNIGSPILFRQERVGLDGRPFTLLKFTSLRPVDETESARNWNIAQDDRLTIVGKFLRRTSLDELPQLWNIVRGDMSLVGPRPERPYFVDEFTQKFPRYMARHRVPAGLTGTAQVHGLRGDTSIADRARFDNYYIENWSLWEDVKILVRTVSQVLGGAGR